MDQALKKPTKRRAKKADGIVCILGEFILTHLADYY